MEVIFVLSNIKIVVPDRKPENNTIGVFRVPNVNLE